MVLPFVENSIQIRECINLVLAVYIEPDVLKRNDLSFLKS